MPKIICPYCCHKFDPSNMVFRLDRAIKMDNNTEKKRDTEDLKAEETFGSSRKSQNKNKEAADEKLMRYYMDMEHQSFTDAVSNANNINPYGCIEIDLLSMQSDITDYNQDMLMKYNFVMELNYKGHHLDQRVCPNCHNQLVQTAGLYDMKMIAMYGDTKSGKTVYLNILQAMLQGEPALGNVGYAFEGQMNFMGTDSERQEHNTRFKQILYQHELPQATPSGKVVPPQVFEYTYKTAESPKQDKTVLLVFRDIPGEDCLAEDKLKRYGFYLKNADGIIVLLDWSKLQAAVPFFNAGACADNRQMESLNNLKTLLATVYADQKIPLPTAVVLAKGDKLKAEEAKKLIDRFGPQYKAIMEVADSNELHQKYVDRKVIDDLNKNIMMILERIGEKRLLGTVDRCFSDYNYFCISSLGEEPKEQLVPETGMTVATVSSITPYRVAEPLYWIMAKNGCIPYRYYEKYEKKDDIKAVQTIYFEDERRNGIAIERHKKAVKENGIKTEGIFGKWKLIERPNSM